MRKLIESLIVAWNRWVTHDYPVTLSTQFTYVANNKILVNRGNIKRTFSKVTTRLSLCADIVFHPNPRLPSRQHTWLNQQAEAMTGKAAWCAEWSAAYVVNHSLVAKPSVWLPGHDLETVLMLSKILLRIILGIAPSQLVGARTRAAL